MPVISILNSTTYKAYHFLAPVGVSVTDTTDSSTVVFIDKPERGIEIGKYVARILGGKPSQACTVRGNPDRIQCTRLDLEPSKTYVVLVEACLSEGEGCGLPT